MLNLEENAVMTSFDDPLNSIFKDLSALQTQARAPTISQVRNLQFSLILLINFS